MVSILVKITKHNSCIADPSVHILLPNTHCLMVKVWWIFEQNQTSGTKQNTKKLTMLTEGWKDGQAENSIPLYNSVLQWMKSDNRVDFNSTENQITKSLNKSECSLYRSV